MSDKIKTTMTFQEANKIVELLDNGPYEYIIRCRFCGDWKRVSTDTPIDFMIKMAQKHEKCKRRKYVGKR